MENTRFYINKIKFNTGEEISLNSSDIILFVGGNNVGKSRTLSEIYNFLGDGKIGNQFILKDANIQSINLENLKDTVEKYSVKTFEYGSNQYRGYDFGVSDHGIVPFQKGRLWQLRNFFACESKTIDRLVICKPCDNINLEHTPTNLLQYLARNQETIIKLNNEFSRTFGTNVICDSYTSNQIILRLSKNVEKLNTDFINVGYDLQRYFSPLPKVVDQGDGIKSFLGILISILNDRCSIYFIDEPESFLHQPQAYAIAQSVANLGTNKQMFISTHSIQILLGLLKACPERLKIIRLNRTIDESGNEINPFTLLDNEHVSEIDKDPLLQYSNIFDGIFYKKVVLVESETDCKFYELIYKNITNGNDYFFTLAHGKEKIPKILDALSKLGLDSSIVFDIDVLNSPNVIKNTLESKSGDFEVIKDDLLIIKHYVESLDEGLLSKSDIKNAVKKLLDENEDTLLSEETRIRCKKLFNPNSGWKQFKSVGKAILNGETLKSFEKVTTYLESKGIFVVECGELEGFVPEFKSSHGTIWIEKVFEKYTDINDSVFDDAKRFVKKL